MQGESQSIGLPEEQEGHNFEIEMANLHMNTYNKHSNTKSSFFKGGSH